MMTKTCSGCQIEKATNEFYKNKTNGDGLQNYCRVCQKKYGAEYYKKYPEEQKKLVMGWSEDHPKENG